LGSGAASDDDKPGQRSGRDGGKGFYFCVIHWHWHNFDQV
jgi:hypothetical protein